MSFKPAYGFMLLSLFVIGCSNQNQEASDDGSGFPKSLSERLAESGGFKQDEHGYWVPKSNKRSSFELERENSLFKGEIEKKAYQTGDYEKKSWWGKKSYDVNEYQGNTDGSRFHKTAAQQGQTAPYGDKRVPTGDPYETNTLDYEIARETNAERLDKPRNDYTESKRRKSVQPPVMDWQEYRKLKIEDTRSILGR